MLQSIAWNLTVVAVAALALLFLWVVRGSGERAPAEDVRTRAYRLRRIAFIVLAVAFFPITAVSLAKDPFGDPDGPGEATLVEVTGHQWYWEVSRTQVPAGQLVLFRVTSADVNHGFALYDEDLRVVGQTQAMPGYANGLAMVLEPGRYRVLCLEYCGLVHHGMTAEIVAVAEEAS